MTRATLALLAPVAALGLAACSADTGLFAGAPTAAATTATLGVALPPDRAMAALPPEAGRVVSVVERRGEGTVRQTITLAGDPGARGEDRIEVVARERRLAGSNRVDEEMIEAELAEALPGVPMTVSSRVVTTPTGPVGVATGTTADGVECLYAWSNGTARSVGPAREVLGWQVASSTGADVSVRVRLCRRGIGEARLVAFAEGLRIRGASPDATTSAPVAVGTDALASAGYASAAAPAPIAPAAAGPARVAKPRTTTPTVVTTARRPAAAPSTPSTVAAPIPLPTSGT